jgi:peptide/nickel transport system substrate-binding protein
MPRTHLITLFLLIVLTITACASPATPTPSVTEPPVTETLAPLPTPTPAPRALNICLGGEPNTLYPYGSPNSPARSVMSALFDGPIDTVAYGYEPIILEKIPNLNDGDAQLSSVTVNPGAEVVDAAGNLVLLSAGTKVRPSGCRTADCAITYDGSSPLEMDQMIVTFTMLADLTWSDGEPLTAADSVYSFQVAASDDTPGSKFLIDRTQIYEAAADGVTLQWWGKPGFIDPDYYTNFWTPLPQHLLETLTPADLLNADVAAKAPVGWGPYILEEWKPGESLHFVKNLNYFRAESGLPAFDELNFIIYSDPNAAITALVDGQCDVLDPSVRLDGQVGLLQQMEQNAQAKLITARTNTMEWLGIGIEPASYDNGFNPFDKTDRPDFFGDPRMRQALAYCLDRQQVVDTVLFGLSSIPDTYLPSDHPLRNGNVQTYAFNPVEGNKLLEQIGWLDHDKNLATPRQSTGVTFVPNTTSLVLNYVTSSAAQRRQVAEILTGSLAQCSIGLNVTYLSASDLYLQGPVGPLFGRQFDLAEYAIGVNSIEPQCSWFTSTQIPTAKNSWIGTNISGFSDAAFDTACNSALQALPEDPAYTSHQQAQAIFATELPSIPLYQRLRIAAALPDFCGFTLDPASSQPLADIESFNYGDGCQ